jgi:hypothetical protein
MSLRTGLPGSSALQIDEHIKPVILQCRTPQKTNPKDHLVPNYVLIQSLFVFLPRGPGMSRKPVLSFNRCATPVKFPIWLCLPHRSTIQEDDLRSKPHCGHEMFVLIELTSRDFPPHRHYSPSFGPWQTPGRHAHTQTYFDRLVGCWCKYPSNHFHSARRLNHS